MSVSRSQCQVFLTSHDLKCINLSPYHLAFVSSSLSRLLNLIHLGRVVSSSSSSLYLERFMYIKILTVSLPMTEAAIYFLLLSVTFSLPVSTFFVHTTEQLHSTLFTASSSVAFPHYYTIHIFMGDLAFIMQ